ncbi:MAG: hypothetical protein IM568_11900 [Flavobacterium sp.]|nr:hypothetical protein [Flavobacterium sp.]
MISSRIIAIVLLTFNLSSNSFSQNKPEDFGFVGRQIKLKNNTINYYIFGNQITLEEKKPLFLYLQGSGANPIFIINKDGSKSSSMILGPQWLNGKYHYVIIGKPGMKFADEESETANPNYDKKMSLDYRVNIADAVINDLIKSENIDKSRVVVAGHSEGGQIAPKIAYVNKYVTHLISLCGTSINQMYDFLIHIRKNVESNKLTKDEGNKEIDSLLTIYKDIMLHPLSTEKKWAGHTYLRWSSTINNPPLQYLLKLNIPIYISVGTADRATTIENMDSTPIEFIKAGKNNLTYKWYWNYDHSFNEIIIKKDGTYEVKNHIPEVMKDVVKWISEN